MNQALTTERNRASSLRMAVFRLEKACIPVETDATLPDVYRMEVFPLDSGKRAERVVPPRFLSGRQLEEWKQYGTLPFYPFDAIKVKGKYGQGNHRANQGR